MKKIIKRLAAVTTTAALAIGVVAPLSRKKPS